jgi:hypothetical protein
MIIHGIFLEVQWNMNEIYLEFQQSQNINGNSSYPWKLMEYGRITMKLEDVYGISAEFSHGVFNWS